MQLILFIAFFALATQNNEVWTNLLHDQFINSGCWTAVILLFIGIILSVVTLLKTYKNTKEILEKDNKEKKAKKQKLLTNDYLD